MKTWWNGLNFRERWLVIMATVLATLLLLYQFAWTPWHKELERLRQSVAQQRTTLAWMRQAALELERLQSTPEAPNRSKRQQDDGRSLPTLVDQTARSAGLGTVLKRVEPQGDGGIRVVLEAADFTNTIRWLVNLERNHGVRTSNAIVERHTNAGQINARLILHRSAS